MLKKCFEISHWGLSKKDFSVSEVLLTYILIFLLIFVKKTNLKTTKKEYVTLLLLYMWAKYEVLLLNFTSKTVI